MKNQEKLETEVGDQAKVEREQVQGRKEKAKILKLVNDSSDEMTDLSGDNEYNESSGRHHKTITLPSLLCK